MACLVNGERLEVLGGTLDLSDWMCVPRMHVEGTEGIVRVTRIRSNQTIGDVKHLSIKGIELACDMSMMRGIQVAEASDSVYSPEGCPVLDELIVLNAYVKAGASAIACNLLTCCDSYIECLQECFWGVHALRLIHSGTNKVNLGLFCNVNELKLESSADFLPYAFPLLRVLSVRSLDFTDPLIPGFLQRAPALGTMHVGTVLTLTRDPRPLIRAVDLHPAFCLLEYDAADDRLAKGLVSYLDQIVLAKFATVM